VGLDVAQERGDILFLSEVSGLETGGLHIFGEVVEFGGIGFVMHAMDGRQASPIERGGNGFVGRQHELFDQLVAFVVFDFNQAFRVALRIDEDLGLRHIEIEAACPHPPSPEF